LVKNIEIIFYFYNILKKYCYFFFYNFEKLVIFFYCKRECITNILYILKKSLIFKYNILIDLSASDFLTINNRFCMYYNILNIFFNYRVYLYYYVNDIINFSQFFKFNDFIYSISKIFFNANWLERELWDMFGIFSIFHKDLRRILTDYGFIGFPLRKDYPLTGFFELRYDDGLKNIVYEKINLIQEYRVFVFVNPWSQFF
jgi:NADH-quinone oxidoreductase subunit C